VGAVRRTGEGGAWGAAVACAARRRWRGGSGVVGVAAVAGVRDAGACVDRAVGTA